MNELERATTALVDRPMAPPAPLEQIERRARTIRRRRHLVEAGAIALVVLLVGTAGLALSAVRDGDDQGVFVGEGPANEPTVTIATYRLSSPLDDATAEALQLTLESRFGYVGPVPADVQVSETEVTIMSPFPADRLDSLVTSAGGFELRTVIGEAPEASCRSAGGGAGDPQAMWTSALTGPPRCLSVEPAVPLPEDLPSPYSTGGDSPDGRSYRFEMALTSDAAQALIDASPPCADQPCLPATIAVVTDGAIVDPGAQVTTSATDTGTEVRIVMAELSGLDDGKLVASLLVNPLPAGVVLTREAADSPATTTEAGPTDSVTPDLGQSTGTTATGLADQPLSADVSSEFCLRSPVDGSTLEATAAVLEARFAAIGQTVTVTPRPNQHGQTASCLSFRTELDPAHPIYSKDVIANFQPSELHVRQDAWEEVLGVTTRTATMLAPDSGMLVVSISSDDYAALTSHHPKVCPPNADCNWLNATVQLGTGSGTAWLEVLEPGSMTLRLDTAADALRWKATIEHPLPTGVVFN